MIAGDYLAFSEIDLEASNSAFEKQADQILYQTLSPSPLIQQNPAYFWELTANFILALGKKNPEKFIGPKPDLEANPGIVDDENQLMLRGQNVQVNPKDDDITHINGHQKFKRESVGILNPEAMTLLVMHIEEHRLQYLQKYQQAQLMGQQGGANASQGQTANPGASSASRLGIFQGPPVTGQRTGQPQMPSQSTSSQVNVGG